MKILDVAIHMNQGLFGRPGQPAEQWISDGKRVQLADDIWVGRLETDLANKVIEKCDPPGMWTVPAPRPAELYTFVREVPVLIPDLWDRDQRLQTCILLSRLVHPTTISLGHAARVSFGNDGKVSEIAPGPVKGQAAYAFISAENHRDWLSESDLGELALLMQRPFSSIPERVRLALWYHEFAATIYYAEIRWPMVCTGLEALTETDKYNLTGQFVRRVSKLARVLEVEGFDESDALAAYQIRNSLVHGRGFLNAPRMELPEGRPEISGVAERFHLYTKLETVLRLALRKSVAGQDFSSSFTDEPSIRQYFEGARSQRTAQIEATVGTRDILPPETERWNFVEAAVRDVFRSYNFHEIRTPIIEDVQLFQRAVGEETDVVSKEMFMWEDRARTKREKDQWLALRPENTAGVVRAYIEHRLWDRGLNKLYYMGPQFRRERPQKGRYRQFYQIGAEVIGPATAGSESPARDAEVLELLATLLDRLGIENWTLELNSIGCANDRAQYNEALRKALEPVAAKMCSDCQRRAVTNPLRVFDCKVPEDQPIIEKLPRISQFLDEPCRGHFEQVQEILKAVAVPFTLNDRLVRGLDYYTRTAFEFTHGALGAQNAILGGGRYDGLSESLGGPSAPGIGFAIGEDRLVLALKESAEAVQPKAEVYIAPLGAGMDREAARLARELRRHDVVAELGDETLRLKKSFEIASKLGARFILIVGENEVKAGAFALKNLESGEQVSVGRAELAQKIQAGR
jgi:histidyl-tRNA synthetase